MKEKTKKILDQGVKEHVSVVREKKNQSQAQDQQLPKSIGRRNSKIVSSQDKVDDANPKQVITQNTSKIKSSRKLDFDDGSVDNDFDSRRVPMKKKRGQPAPTLEE